MMVELKAFVLRRTEELENETGLGGRAWAGQFSKRQRSDAAERRLKALDQARTRGHRSMDVESMHGAIEHGRDLR